MYLSLTSISYLTGQVIRNAGGRAADALRSVVISQQLLGTREIVIVHHTDCGMLTFSNEDVCVSWELQIDF